MLFLKRLGCVYTSVVFCFLLLSGCFEQSGLNTDASSLAQSPSVQETPQQLQPSSGQQNQNSGGGGGQLTSGTTTTTPLQGVSNTTSSTTTVSQPVSARDERYSILQSPELLAELNFSKSSFIGSDDSLALSIYDKESINEKNLYIIANLNDPSSIELANQYVQLRQLNSSQIIKISLPVKASITYAEAQTIQDTIALYPQAKGFAIAWSIPYTVGGKQTITSYVSMGRLPFENWSVNTYGCYYTNTSAYYDFFAEAFTRNPSSVKSVTLDTSGTVRVRPSMLLSSHTSQNISTLSAYSPLSLNTADYIAGALDTISKGINADHKEYSASGYFGITSDTVRSRRANTASYDPRTVNTYSTTYKKINLNLITGNTIGGKKDILIFQTGLANLDPSESQTNVFLPGAIADTLTSFSGSLYGGGQVSALAFLRAGATASYGTSFEPCAYYEKFPESIVYVPNMLVGDTLLEAYWKSVKLPAEGIFIGEPLARPYAKGIVAIDQTNRILRTHIRRAAIGTYNLYLNLFGIDTLIASQVQITSRNMNLNLLVPLNIDLKSFNQGKLKLIQQ